MKEELLAAPLPTRVGFGQWRTRAGYGLAIGIGGGLASLLLVLISGPPFSNGERWQAIALGWFFLGGGVLIVSSAVSGVFLHRYFIGCRSRTARVLVFATNVSVVAALALLTATWAAGF